MFLSMTNGTKTKTKCLATKVTLGLSCTMMLVQHIVSFSFAKQERRGCGKNNGTDNVVQFNPALVRSAKAYRRYLIVYEYEFVLKRHDRSVTTFCQEFLNNGFVMFQQK